MPRTRRTTGRPRNTVAAREFTTVPVEVWGRRWEGFKKVIKTIVYNNTKAAKDAEQVLGPEPVYATEYFQSLLCNLQGFVEEHQQYFKLNHKPRAYALDYALNATFNQVGFDLTVISHAWRQRHMKQFKASLERADLVAEACVQQAVNAGMFRTDATPASLEDAVEPRPIVLTYFQKIPTIRMMPYSPVMLVGIPYTAYFELPAPGQQPDLESIKELLSVVHEVGHLVFWKGHNNDANAKFASFLNRKYQYDKGLSLSPWTANGGEQIISDVFAARAAGVASALTSQERARQHQLDRYFADDLRYQVMPSIRPEIYLKILDDYGDVGVDSLFKDAGKHWGDEWEKDQEELLNGATTVMPYGGTSKISLKTAQDELSKAVAHANVLLKTDDPASGVSLLQAKLGNGQFSDVLKQAYQNAPGPDGLKDTKKVYEAWDTFVNALQPRVWDPVTELGLFHASVVLGQDQESTQFCNNSYWNNTTWPIWLEILQTEEKMQPAPENSGNDPYNTANFRDWFTALYAGGWVMESPGNSSGPK